MPIPNPRWLVGRPRVALAASRILPATCTTPYGESPGDDEIAALVREFAGADCPAVPWFPVAHRDTPAGTVWSVLVCPPLDRSTGRNPSEGADPARGARCEVVLPEVLWAVSVLGAGSGRLRETRSPEGVWISTWSEGMVDRVDGPFPDDAAVLRSWRSAQEAPPEDVAWMAPEAGRLQDLAADHPEAQMLEPRESLRREELLADRTTLARGAAILVAAIVLGAIARLPVVWAGHVLSRTEARLASVRPDLDRLDGIRRQAVRDARFLDSSQAAFRPSASPWPLLSGIARGLPGGVRLQTLQLESPPGDSGWTLRIDARLPDWRGVAGLVDSLRRVPSVRDVHVETQQREQEKVHLVLTMDGTWP